MATRPAKDYKPEFSELGIEKVRRELVSRRWQPDKLAAARIWVESKDAHSWVADRGDGPPSDKKNRFRKWAVYIAAVFGIGYVAVRVFRSFNG